MQDGDSVYGYYFQQRVKNTGIKHVMSTPAPPNLQLIPFFERIHAEHGMPQSHWPGLVSSHPLSSERLAELRQLQKRSAAEPLTSDHH